MLINGVATEWLPATDRGLAYGDGIFRTVELLNGQPRLWRWHWQRLAADCTALQLPCPDQPLLLEELLQVGLCHERAVAKITLTRGAGQRGYAMPSTPDVTQIVSASPWAGYPAEWAEQGVQLCWCETRLGIQPRLAGIKHLNRLENVLARSEWQDLAIAEGLMCDSDGFVIEGTMSNLFLLSDGLLQTPLLDRCGVAGAMRAWVMETAARLGLLVQEVRLSKEQLLQADEVFICNSLAGIWPVVSLPERTWQIGTLTRRLQQEQSGI